MTDYFDDEWYEDDDLEAKLEDELGWPEVVIYEVCIRCGSYCDEQGNCLNPDCTESPRFGLQDADTGTGGFDIEWYEDKPDDEVYGEETDDFAHVDDYSEAEQNCMLCSGPCGQCDEGGGPGLTREQRIDFFHALTRYSELDLREDPPDTSATGENSSPASD